MSLIDTSYFYGDLSIAQVTEESVETVVKRFIVFYEPALLTNLLGYELYKNYQAGILAGTQKYKDIRDGKEYTNRAGRFNKWRGLRQTLGSEKFSLIANYTYYHYLRTLVTQTTATGEKSSNAQNAVGTSSAFKMSRAWNQMVEWNWELVEFLLSNPSDYPEFLKHYGCRELENVLTTINPFF
jgi:hypothetical protein